MVNHYPRTSLRVARKDNLIDCILCLPNDNSYHKVIHIRRHIEFTLEALHSLTARALNGSPSMSSLVYDTNRLTFVYTTNESHNLL